MPNRHYHSHAGGLDREDRGGVTRFSRSKSKGKGKKHASPPPQAQAEEPNVDDDVEADLSSVRNVSAGSDPSARASKSVGRQSTGAAPQGSSSQTVPAPSTRRKSAPPVTGAGSGSGGGSSSAAPAASSAATSSQSTSRRTSGTFGEITPSRPAAASGFGSGAAPVAADAASGSGSSDREITITSAMTPAEAMARVMVVLGGAAAGPIFIYMLQKHMEEHVERFVKVALTVRSLVIAVVEYNVVLMLLKY
ncbi:hypothetical protein Esi_0419_0007 [Ectocarpus siliculosus]|uniref:Uncharacterized protein n=1 Tax=Ectocarpus siliculosus TaxID=2880 RepID=D7G0S0_ECTSI|nr:hypothetical protein Esi_0419_0007 [Ectocarpus siliculosus]|eukprot:CBJ33099.1 hypothetical protein Esi_0419_0007 [Ectocarpus siliculosus]